MVTMASPTTEIKPILFNVPPLILNYAARQVATENLLNELGNKKNIIISGPEGVGKTTLCIKIANIYRERFGGSIVWINADSAVSVKESICKLCKYELSIPVKEDRTLESIMEDVNEWFQRRECLFVFDNFDSDLSILKLLTNQQVLITCDDSNRVDLKKFIPDAYTLHLGVFDKSEALEYAKKCLSITDDSMDDDLNYAVEYFMFYPFALRHAINDFRKMRYDYKKRRMSLSFFDFLNYYIKSEPTFMKTFENQLQKIISSLKNETHGNVAYKVYSMCSYLALKQLPLDIFLEEYDEKVLTEITALLLKHSLFYKENKAINCYGLGQNRNRKFVQKEEESILHNLLILFRNSIVKDGENDLITYAPHAISIWKYAIQYDSLITEFIVNDTIGQKQHLSIFHLLVNDADLVMELGKRIPSKYFMQIINMKTKTSKKSPLHLAIEYSNVKTVKYLLERNASVDSKNNMNLTPLHVAMTMNNKKIIDLLMNANPNLDKETSKKFKFTPAHFASNNGDADTLKKLMSAGVDINASTTYDFSPLHLAAKGGNTEVVAALLQSPKIMVDARTKWGYTPLHLAAAEGHQAAVCLLAKAGADINAQNNSGFTPLHEASIGNRAEVVRELMKHRQLEVDAKTTHGKTASDLASEKCYEQIVRMIQNRL